FGGLGNVASFNLLDVRLEVEARFRQRLGGRRYGLRGVAPDTGGQAVRQNRRRRLEGNRPLEHVLELPDVPGPVVAEEQVHRLTRHAGYFLVHLLVVLGEKMVRQQRYVLAAIPERRQRNRDDVDPVEEIFAEPAVRDRLRQILV